MKKLIAALLLMSAASLGCTESTSFGPCIGAFDEKTPHTVYKISGWNIVMGIIFAEMIIPPVIVLADETLCPVGVKP